MTTFKRMMAAGLAAATLVTASEGLVTPAAAEHGHNAAAIAAGAIGGLALGAIVAGAASGPAYAAPPPPPRYYGPAVYAPPPPPPCMRRRPTYDAYGNFAGYRMFRTC